MGNPVVTAIFLVLRLGIGLILLRLALKDSRYRNLHWLAACFYLNVLVLFLNGARLMLVSQIVVIMIQICLSMFTHTTFYQNRRSPVAWVIGGLVVGGGGSLYLWQRFPGSGFGGLRLMMVICAANWLWHAFVAHRIWRSLRLDRSIEDWVKARYVMVVTYAIAMAALFLLLIPAGRVPRPVVRWAWPTITMVSVVLQYLAWGMPAVLRRYLNRNYQPSAAAQQAMNMTEEDVLRALEKPAH